MPAAVVQRGSWRSLVLCLPVPLDLIVSVLCHWTSLCRPCSCMPTAAHLLGSPLPPALQGKHVVCVSVGDWHNAAICQDGRLYVWGRGDCG